ncbi:hypothetical protein ACWM9A_05135 [Acetobacter pasteurianus]
MACPDSTRSLQQSGGGYLLTAAFVAYSDPDFIRQVLSLVVGDNQQSGLINPNLDAAILLPYRSSCKSVEEILYHKHGVMEYLLIDNIHKY